jgi:hypothetical protein
MKLLPTLLTSLSLAAARLSADSIVTEWNDDFLQTVRTAKFGPPQTARAEACRKRGHGIMALS